MRAFRKTATVLCGLVFLFSAVAKLLSVRSFELYVFSLGLLSFDFTSLAARLLILLEGCTGLWFLSGWKLRWAKWIAWAQLAFFSAFLFWRIFLADGASCHCFGELIDLNPWQSLGKNVLLALLIALSAEELWPRPLRPLYLAAVGLAAGIGLFVASPPDRYYRQGREIGYVVPDKWEALEKEHPPARKTYRLLPQYPLRALPGPLPQTLRYAGAARHRPGVYADFLPHDQRLYPGGG